MVFQESNNREVARKYAEYITSVPLRRFVAEKVREYCGDLPLSIFDGVCGSGQLEQFSRWEVCMLWIYRPLR
ncbi:TPA: hypothetical protein ACHJ9E_005510, partial [Escherichia coli]